MSSRFSHPPHARALNQKQDARLPNQGERTSGAGADEPPIINGPQTYTDVACTRCGCVCDDLQLDVDKGCVIGVAPPCALAEPWLLGQTSGEGPVARVAQRAVAVPQAIEHAANVLRTAVSPLIYGLSRSSTPGQRAAVRLADRIGATIDTTASTCHAPSIMALQAVGESTCSLGEIRNRADLILYWGSDPMISHPRHTTRFVDAAGQFIPGGRADRHMVVIDVQQTATAELADTFIQVAPGKDFELIWALRALLRGLPVSSEFVGGVSLQQLRSLKERLHNCRYGAVFFGLGLTSHSVPHATVEAVLRLVTDLNAHTRFVARRMRIPGDVAGADSVLCWQTGYPFAVNLNRGYPRYNPGEYTANNVLERREADAALLVGTDGFEKLSAAAQQHLREIPCVVLDAPGVECPLTVEVHFTTAVYGIHRTGTAYRMDEVPIPLCSVLASPLPSDDEVLLAITAALDGPN